MGIRYLALLVGTMAAGCIAGPPASTPTSDVGQVNNGGRDLGADVGEDSPADPMDVGGETPDTNDAGSMTSNNTSTVPPGDVIEEEEPNDGQEEAALFEVGDRLIGRSDAADTTADYWAIDLDEGKIFELTVETEGALVVRFDPPQPPPTQRVLLTGFQDTRQFFVSVPGRHFVRVTPKSDGETDYKMTSRVVEASIGTVPLPSTHQDDLSDGTPDVRVVRPTEAGDITATLVGTGAQSDPFLIVWNPGDGLIAALDDNQPSSDPDQADKNAQITFTAEADVRYWIVATGWHTPVESEYELTIEPASQ